MKNLARLTITAILLLLSPSTIAGILYASVGVGTVDTRLIRIDTNTGDTTNIASLMLGDEFIVTDLTSDGTHLFGIKRNLSLPNGSSRIVQINPNTGDIITETLITGLPTNFSGVRSVAYNSFDGLFYG